MNRLNRLVLNIFFVSLIALSLISKVKAADEAKEVLVNSENLSGAVVHNEGYYIPRGMLMDASLLTPVDTRISKIGDIITVQTSADLLISDYNIIPANSFLHGYISLIKPPGKLFKKPQLEITFDKASIPGQNGRQELFIQGKVNVKEFKAKATNVSDGSPFSSRVKKKAALAGLSGAAIGFATRFGVPAMAGGFLGGAVIGASLVTRDDMRIETGTDLEIIFEEPTMYNPVDNTSQLAEYKAPEPKLNGPGEAYDRIVDMQAFEL